MFSNGAVVPRESVKTPAGQTSSQPQQQPKPDVSGNVPDRDWSNPANWGFDVDGMHFQTPQDYQNWLISNAQGSQEDAAKKAAEARRQAALGKYQAQQKIGEQAKGQAKGNYDWIIDTLGSNKADVLAEIALNEKQGLEDYALQQEKTKTNYDKSRQEILSTYRDLNTEQEKLMRGMGMSTSSRSLEAQMKLNNLLGKDLSQLSTNEADSLALIGNAIVNMKERTTLSKNSVETETKSKLDKAALDYKANIDNIDANLYLSEMEREESYANAEAQLATDIANVNTWATQAKLQVQQQMLANSETLNGYISSMLDDKGLLGQGLDAKTSATNAILEKMGYTPMDTETNLTNPSQGQYQKAKMSYSSKEALDNALANGQISTLEYQNQLSQMMRVNPNTAQTTQSTNRGLPSYALPTNQAGQNVQQDPMLAAIFGNKLLNGI